MYVLARCLSDTHTYRPSYKKKEQISFGKSVIRETTIIASSQCSLWQCTLQDIEGRAVNLIVSRHLHACLVSWLEAWSSVFCLQPSSFCSVADISALISSSTPFHCYHLMLPLLVTCTRSGAPSFNHYPFLRLFTRVRSGYSIISELECGRVMWPRYPYHAYMNISKPISEKFSNGRPLKSTIVLVIWYIISQNGCLLLINHWKHSCLNYFSFKS